MICPSCERNIPAGAERTVADPEEAAATVPSCPNCGYIGPMFLTPREEAEAGLRPRLRLVPPEGVAEGREP